LSDTASPNVEIYLSGAKVDDNAFLSYVVDRDMFQPDMAAVVLSNQGDKYSRTKIGDPLELKVGDKSTSIYKGEVVGLEPVYKGGEKTRITIRGMNKLHNLLRARKSITFTDKTDQQILSQVVGDAGLSLDWKHDKSITYKHVYQHNQTDLEFLRMRAGRAGCMVWCVDSTVFCKQPDLQSSHIVELNGTNGKKQTAVTHIPTDCEAQENPGQEGIYFKGANATLTVNTGTTVSFPKVMTDSGNGLSHTQSGAPYSVEGSSLFVFNQRETQSSNQAGETLDTAFARLVAQIESLGYTR